MSPFPSASPSCGESPLPLLKGGWAGRTEAWVGADRTQPQWVLKKGEPEQSTRHRQTVSQELESNFEFLCQDLKLSMLLGT